MANPTIKATAQHMGKNAKNVVKENHFKAVCKSGEGRRDHSKPRQKKGKGKKFHEVNKEEGVMDDLSEQVQASVL